MTLQRVLTWFLMTHFKMQLNKLYSKDFFVFGFQINYAMYLNLETRSVGSLVTRMVFAVLLLSWMT